MSIRPDTGPAVPAPRTAATPASATTPRAISDFLGTTTAGDALPEILALPLSERHRLLAAGEIGAEEFRARAAHWAARADGHYRACAELRVPTGGLRLGVKDTVDVQGFATRLGLRHYRHHPRTTAAVLRDVTNAEVVAKVVTTELNIGVGSGCVNPYFPHIDPAGSSTGSAVAVAANICDVSLGTDVLGSVRWPAGRCGVVGLRVTHHPRNLPGVFPLSPAMDAPGWVARTADDLAFAWQHMGLGGPVPTGGRLRVGVPRELSRPGVLDPEITRAVAHTAELLRSAGHDVVEADLGELWDCRADAWQLCARDAWDGFQHWRAHIEDDLLDSTFAALCAGADVGDEEYAVIRDRMTRLRATLPAHFADRRVDAWLLPLDPALPRPRGTVPPAASTIPVPGDPRYDREIGFTPVASFAGLPAITFPAGVDPASDVPVAMQLVAGPHREGALIAAARDVSDTLGDLRLRPRGVDVPPVPGASKE
ncbi:amidase [Streptomyces sp. NPDC005907]|uniref:amidase n=1 Tax=Streptomyces sp. NPDC005907 TaxID=3154571 RepID=UPI0033EFA8B4